MVRGSRRLIDTFALVVKLLRWRKFLFQTEKKNKTKEKRQVTLFLLHIEATHEIKKYTLTGLENFSKESILRITPVSHTEDNSQTVQPLHQYIQDYNGEQFLLMLFVGEKINASFCHFNGTEKKIETLARPTHFNVDGRTFVYKNEKWISA